MPELSKSEIQRRTRMVEQELRIIEGGTSLKEQLQYQIRELQKCKLSDNPPPDQALTRVINSIHSQINLIDDPYQRKVLSEYLQKAQAFLAPELRQSNPEFFSAKSSQASHIDFPIIANWCRNEQEMFFELSTVLSELNHKYEPKVFLNLFFDCIQKYEETHGTLEGFVEKVYATCRENRELLKDIFSLFRTDAMQDLSQKLGQLKPKQEEQ